MTTDIERSLQRENVRLMLALDDLAFQMSPEDEDRKLKLIDVALQKASAIAIKMPDSYIEKLLVNQKIIREVTIDVSHID